MHDIKDKKLFYHLTSLENLSSILRGGLKPRAQLDGFADVADAEILRKRQALGLEHYVPFHWFAANPFDGRIQLHRPNTTFVLISVYRSFASQHGWKVIPRHPLANDAIQLLDYNEGVEWDVMSERDYQNPHCKSVCMAECLSPDVVLPKDFSRIYVPSDEVEKLCATKMREAGVKVPVGVNPGMFL
jgi:hypothetical protein